MKNTAKISNDSGNLIVYFILAFAISWSIGIPLAFAHHGIIAAILPQWTHYMVAYGPLLAALIVTGISQGLPGLKDLGKRMIRWACPKWLLVAFSPLILGYVIILILNRLTGSQIGLSDFSAASYLSPLSTGTTLLLWILTFGLGEETGWRGFALPRLQKERSALAATMILTAFGALWDLPQFFYVLDPFMAVGWVIGLFAGAVILTWLYNSAKDSILMVAIWHGCFNLMTASRAEVGMLPMLLTALIIVWAVIVVIRYKPKYLMSI
jgi:membrane protease YdiL (CAAX protease family)